MATNGRVRINLVLPKRTLETADRFWPVQNFHSRSDFVDEAMRYYMQSLRERRLREKLREELRQGYQATAKENLALAAELESADAPLPDDGIEMEY